MAGLYPMVPASTAKVSEAVSDSLDEIGEVVGGLFDGVQSLFESTEKDVRLMFAVESMCRYVEGQKIGSVPYFYAIESCSKALREITAGEAIPFVVPSMEDFKNPNATRYCHTVAMESWRERVADLWKRFKKFFKELAQRFTLVFRRLLKMDLQLEEYEEYVEKMIVDVKHNNAKVLVAEMIDTKLPQILSVDGNNFDVDNLCREGVDRIQDFIKVFEALSGSTGKFSSIVSELSDGLASLEATTRNNFTTMLPGTFDQDERREIVDKANQTVREEVSKLQGKFITSITDVFSFSEVGAGDSVPDKVRTAELNARGSDSELKKAFVMVDVLPSNFSIYLLQTTEDGSPVYEVICVNELNRDVPAKLQTITNPSNLIALNAVYRALIKVKPDRLASQFDRTTKEIDKIIESSERIEKAFPSDYRFSVNKDLIRFVNTINIISKETTFGISQVLAQLRFELIRYIFKSCENLKAAD